MSVEAGPALTGFVPRTSTGFQVKRQDMPRAAIIEEMRPSNALRTVIRELADASGAYVIVSSQGSVSDSALRSRRNAMADAIADLSNAGDLLLDFFDRTRVASWVRSHPGLIPWVREKIGKPVQGWQAFGAWAYAPEGNSAEFLMDDFARIQTGQKDDGEGLPVQAAIARMREILGEPGRVVRLIGLSGVGKTRLVQALFDRRVGDDALDASLALYTNMSDDPDLQPTGMVSDVVASGMRAIMVVDNCEPDLHRRISELCRGKGSVSAITIEYDIREDQPEGTEVFELYAASPDLVEQLVRRRFPRISQVDARTIAESSGGNARVAIALAGTLGRSETISGLTDEQLFRRLFQQRHAPDQSLLLAAQACSLVYSFEGETLSGDGAELPLLAGIIGSDVAALFRSVAELRRRDLVQQRGVWRAVLPHAVANRLAKTALQNFPAPVIEQQLYASARLLKSFSRRLGFVHDAPEAVRIVSGWFSPDGMLGNVSRLNDLECTLLNNVAPTAPREALAALERGLNQAQIDREFREIKRFTDILRAIAYEADLFERSATILARLAILSGADEASKAFQSLFFILLSGTHATVEQRIKVANELLISHDPKARDVGLAALDAMLEAWHFTSFYRFQFGAHHRDHGFAPRTSDEAQAWFVAALALCERCLLVSDELQEQVRAVIARRFRGLWTRAGVLDQLDQLARLIGKDRHWPDGWRAARETLRYDGESLRTQAVEQLKSIEVLLRPRNLIDNIRSMVFPDRALDVDLDDLDSDNKPSAAEWYEVVERRAETLGSALSLDEAALDILLPELLVSRGRLWSLGRGMATATSNPVALWNRLHVQFQEIPVASRNIQVMRGFLHGLQNEHAQLIGDLLDSAIQDESLIAWVPSLQTAISIDDVGFDRLMKVVRSGVSPDAFKCLMYGRATDSISGPAPCGRSAQRDRGR